MDIETIINLGLSLLTAMTLCSLIGIERMHQHKPAGIRTHAIVGMSSALFTMVGSHGFTAITAQIHNFDPTRVAAQVVSGIGFIGAGLIFVNRHNIQGLTTAASVWFSAAVGMACASELKIPAVIVVVLYFILLYVFSPLIAWLLKTLHSEEITIEYDDTHGTLRKIMQYVTSCGISARIEQVSKKRLDNGQSAYYATLVFKGIKKGSFNTELITSDLSEIKGVKGVHFQSIHDE